MYHLPVDVIFKMRMQMENTRNIKINRLELRLAAGMRTHEAQPRPVWVTLHVKAQSHSSSAALADCLDYELRRHWMCTAWSRTPHAFLLETFINEMTALFLAIASQVQGVFAGLYRRTVIGDALAVRKDRETDRNHYEATRALAQVSEATHG